MIEVRSLYRRYGDTTAVDDVSFRIGDRQVVGLLGHNGAGKTTIMRILSGFMEPSSGEILYDSSPVAGDARELQRQLGYLPENLPLYPGMLVADYLDYAASLKRIARGERMAAVREALAAADLRDRALDRIDTLSRGMRQRLGVAQAILGQPRLLILDEPGNGLDLHHTAHMRQLIRREARRATIILSTHILQEVEALCDRVLVLRNGRLVLDRELASLRDSHRLQLRCGDAPDGLATLLRRLPQIAQVQAGAVGEFELQLHPHSDRDSAAGNVARCVIESGARLYQLQSQATDLDQVLRDAAAGESRPGAD